MDFEKVKKNETKLYNSIIYSSFLEIYDLQKLPSYTILRNLRRMNRFMKIGTR